MICDGFQEGLHEGIFNVTDEKMKITRLTCKASGAPYCEYVCEWATEAEEQ